MSIHGFTPCLDGITKKHGILAAAVCGKIMRYQSMSLGYCIASQDRIGEELSLSRQTVNKYIALLISEGYVEEVERHGRTVTYRATKKAQLVISTTEERQQMSTPLTADVKEIDTKKESKKEVKKEYLPAQKGAGELIRLFSKITHIPEPTLFTKSDWAKFRTRWTAPLQRYDLLSKEHNIPLEKLIREAMAIARKRKSDIGTPASLDYFVSAVFAKPTQEDIMRERYPDRE